MSSHLLVVLRDVTDDQIQRHMIYRILGKDIPLVKEEKETANYKLFTKNYIIRPFSYIFTKDLLCFFIKDIQNCVLDTRLTFSLFFNYCLWYSLCFVIFTFVIPYNFLQNKSATKITNRAISLVIYEANLI